MFPVRGARPLAIWLMVGFSVGLNSCGDKDTDEVPPIDTPTPSPTPVEEEKVAVAITDSARTGLTNLLSKKWSVSFEPENMPEPVACAPPRSQDWLVPSGVKRQDASPSPACKVVDGVRIDCLGKTYAFQLFSPASAREFCVKYSSGYGVMGSVRLSYAACTDLDASDSTLRLWVFASTDGTSISEMAPVVSFRPWAFEAALAPGGRHVRVYLRTVGEITTVLSKKDNFVKFLEPGTVCRDVSTGVAREEASLIPCGPDIGQVAFLDTASRQLATLLPPNPNISKNDAGVYVMTWDNLDPTSLPDSQAFVDTFGLAFSVDGLNWTVYSNQMKIEGHLPSTKRGDIHSISFTGKVRGVAPVFVSNDQIRLSFTAETVSTCLVNPSPEHPSACPGLDLPVTSCSLATAVSN